jgi:hypothetical protein
MGLDYVEKNGGRSHSQVLLDPLRIRSIVAQSTQNYLETRLDPALVLVEHEPCVLLSGVVEYAPP